MPAIIALTVLAGCASQTLSSQQDNQIQAATESLNARQPQRAIDIAGTMLQAEPDGPEAAEAYYFKGRGFEMKTAATLQETQTNLRMARANYEEALSHDPSPNLAGDIHASLSNVAFFQGDYPTALNQSQQAYNLSDSVDRQSDLLFRIAICEQRMGRFTDADQTFGLVQTRFPNSTVAQRSQQMQGQRNFYVQLATYKTAAGADKALTELQTGVGAGLPLSKQTNNSGMTVINAGPYPSYNEAEAARKHYQAYFPDAVIKP